MDNAQFHGRMQHIEELIAAIQEHGNPVVRASAAEMVRALLDVHRAGLAEMLAQIVRQGEPGQVILRGIVQDNLVSRLLLLHGLHPVDLETRIRQALDQVRPLLQRHAADVQLQKADHDAVRLRLTGGGDDVHRILEHAMLESAPDVLAHRIRRCRCPHLQPIVAAFGSGELAVDFTLAEPIARALLYEGYLLYPYRVSSLKNCRLCALGSLYPRAYSLANGETELWSMQTECLVRGDGQTTLQGRIRFLHPLSPHPSSGESGERGERAIVEREVVLPACALREVARQSARIGFTFPDGAVRALEGCVELRVEVAGDAVFKVHVRIANETPLDPADRPNRIEPTMLSTHAVLGVDGGRFLSLIDPPGDVAALAETCRNRGCWPVLVGDRDRQDLILAAPIILYDFPQIAPESPGNLFDGTEIDELLTLRILTLTPSEKHAMQHDERTRALLERTEQLAGDQLLALHGATRDIHFVGAATSRLRPGDQVRLRPVAVARSANVPQPDILDLALDGKPATIASIEQDFEGRVFYTVTLDDDPGQDLGREGKPGHRFFFRREELELRLEKPRILIAGVGNLFRGDDAFGSEVARCLAAAPMPPAARVVDFGIRGHDLAFALQDDYAAVILLDVTQRDGVPGTLYVIEPNLEDLHADAPEEIMDTHGMHPLRVLRLIQAAGGKLPRLWLVGCEPGTFGPEEGHMGLSEPVAAAVPKAVALVHSLLKRIGGHEQ